MTVYIYITLCNKTGSQQLYFEPILLIFFQFYESEKLKVLWIHKNYGKKPLCNAQSIT